MKLIQKLPLWILILIVSIIGIVQSVCRANEEIRDIDYSLETIEGSANVLDGMALEIQLYDGNSSYYTYDTSKNQTSIWNSVVPLTKEEERQIDYRYGERKEEGLTYLQLYSDGSDILNKLQELVIDKDIIKEGGTYYLKDYFNEMLFTIFFLKNNQSTYIGNINIDATTFPLKMPITDEMCIIIEAQKPSTGNVSQSSEIKMEGIPHLSEKMPIIQMKDRMFFTIAGFGFPSEYLEGETGIMEIQKDGKIKVLYSIPYHNDSGEKVIGLDTIGEDEKYLVLVTKKDNTLLAYCYDIEAGKVIDTITLCSQMPDDITEEEIVFTTQGNYLNIKLQYYYNNEEVENDKVHYKERNHFYGSILLEEEQLNCVFSTVNIKPTTREAQLLHNRLVAQEIIKEQLYFKDGILYEAYAIWYFGDIDGNASDWLLGDFDYYYTNGIMLCALNEKAVLYYGKLHGVYEIKGSLSLYSEFWNVGELDWRSL